MSNSKDRPVYEALIDGCDGDSEGLKAALGNDYTIIRCWGDDSEGYGHNSYNTIYQTANGKIIHAECGGCSCGGSGSWSYCDNMLEAIRLVPEDEL